MLELMSPWEYTAEVRPVLGHGSGFDSPGWNRVRHAAPGLSRRSTSSAAPRGLSLGDVYVQGREREDLYQLAEALTDLDEWATTWRVRHFMVVERIIGGHVVGTQGTPVELLGKLVDRKLYPELWKVRTELTNRAIEGNARADHWSQWSGAAYDDRRGIRSAPRPHHRRPRSSAGGALLDLAWVLAAWRYRGARAGPRSPASTSRPTSSPRRGRRPTEGVAHPSSTRATPGAALWRTPSSTRSHRLRVSSRPSAARRTESSRVCDPGARMAVTGLAGGRMGRGWAGAFRPEGRGGTAR